VKLLTDRQTDKRHYITSLADNWLQQHCPLHRLYLVVKCPKCVFTNTITQWDHTHRHSRHRTHWSQHKSTDILTTVTSQITLIADTRGFHLKEHSCTQSQLTLLKLRTYCILYLRKNHRMDLHKSFFVTAWERKTKWGKMQIQVQNH